MDTTNGGINAFLAAMLLYPHVQEKARAEVDSVIGTDRMPTFDDLDDLPYVRAVMMETNRWKPLTPMGMLYIGTYLFFYSYIYFIFFS